MRIDVKFVLEIPDDHRLLADPDVVDKDSDAFKLLASDVTAAIDLSGLKHVGLMHDVAITPRREWRTLTDTEIAELAEQLQDDGPVRLPDGADETDTLVRLQMHGLPGVHIAERTELDGTLIHR